MFRKTLSSVIAVAAMGLTWVAAPAADAAHSPNVVAPAPVAAKVRAADTGPQGHPWFDGNFQYHQYNRQCFPEGWINSFVISYVGYEQESDGSFPKVNDVYYAHFVAGVAPLSSCAGGADLVTEIILPDNTNFAVDASHPVNCWFTSGQSNQRFLVTNDPDAGCPTNPASNGQGQFGRLMGGRIVANGATFEIEVPLRSTQPLHGLGQTGSQLVMPAIVTIAENDVTDPRQFVNVGASATGPPFVSYPQPSATNITRHDATTTSLVYTEGHTGHVFFQMGKTTSYGLFRQNIPDLLDSGGAYSVFANEWNGGNGGLDAGTTYHWRMCFKRDDNAQTTCGIDQKFSTLSGETVKPTATPPVHALAVSIQLGSDDQNQYVPVGFRWGGTDNVTKDTALRFRLQWRAFENGSFGPFHTIVNFERVNTAILGVFPGFKYQFRVQAKDAAGNVGTFALGKAFTVHLVQAEDDTRVTQSAPWFGTANPLLSDGEAISTSTPGNKATMTFSGRSIAPVMTTGAGNGTASVCVDGTCKSNLNLDPSSVNVGQRMLVFSRDGLSSTGTHRITVKDVSGSIVLDAFAFLS